MKMLKTSFHHFSRPRFYKLIGRVLYVLCASVLAVATALVLAIATLEFGLRLLDAPNTPSMYREVSRGFEDWTQLQRDVYECAKAGTKYYDYFLYSPPPCDTATLNVSDFFSSRETPASRPVGTADLTVWIFGGSTMQEYQTTDERTIANAIAKSIAAAGIGVRVENFGVPSFQSSLELVKFVNMAARAPADRLPDVVVFYDGFNDTNLGYYFGAGSMQGDLSSKLAALVEQKGATLFLYASLGLGNYSAFWSRYVRRRLDLALFRYHEQPDERNLRRAVEIYVRNTGIASGICAAIQARCFFVLQPLIATKTPLGSIEEQVIADTEPSLIEFVRRFYQATANQMRSSAEFIDASAVLNDHPENFFWDLGHVSAFGAPMIGEFIATEILARLRDGATTANVDGDKAQMTISSSPYAR